MVVLSVDFGVGEVDVCEILRRAWGEELAVFRAVPEAPRP